MLYGLIMNIASGSFIVFSVCLLASCSMERTYSESDLPEPANAQTGVHGGTDARSLDIALPGTIGPGGMEGVKKIEASSLEQMLATHPVGDLTFTDPLKPDADNEQIDEAFSAASVRKRGWQESYSDALRQARRSGKPILIWFHDSKNSPNSNSLAVEVFEKDEFNDWAKENLVRVRYDKQAKFEITGLGSYEQLESEKLAAQKEEFIRKAFEHFNVRGTPTIVMLHPDGQQLHTIKGYRSGQIVPTMDQIRHCTNIALTQHQELRKRLEPSGFRDWQGKNEVILFAKLIRHNQKTGDIWLKEFDGTTTKTNIKSLNKADREWVAKNPVPPVK